MNKKILLSKLILSVCGLTILFILLNFLVAAIPLNLYEKNIASAYQTGDLKSVDDAGFDTFRGQHQYQDCLVLQQGLHLGNSLVDNALNAPYYGLPKCDTLKKIVVDKVVFGKPAPYYQYLHGFRTLTVGLLSLMDLRALRFLLKNLSLLFIFAISLRVALSPQLSTNVRTSFAMVFFIIFSFFHGIDFFGMNLSHGYGDLLSFGTAYFFLSALQAKNHEYFLLIAAISGTVSAYLEYLVGIIPGTLCLSALFILLFHLGNHLNYQSAIKLFFFSTLCFIGSFIFTYFVFLTIKIIWTGYSWAGFLLDFGLRTSHTVNQLPITYGETLHRLWRATLWLGGGNSNLPHLLLSISFVSILFVGLLSYIKPRLTNNTRYFSAALFALGIYAVIFGWYFVLQNHSYVHEWFMVRLLSYPMFAGLFLVCCYSRDLHHNRRKHG